MARATQGNPWGGRVLTRPLWLVLTFAFTALAWSLGGHLWTQGERSFAVSVFALGLSLGPCLAGYLGAPRRHKQLLRRIVLVTGGLSVLTPALFGRVDLDLEGFFMLLFTAAVGVAVGHTLVSVLAGPFLFGRVLCGWGCWRSMVLELLPIPNRPGRRRGAWGLLPMAGLAASVGFAALAVFALGVRPGGRPQALHAESVVPIAVACCVYYAAAIGLAFGLGDARAFCKYLCPSGAILRVTSRTSLAKVSATGGDCDGCGACSRACPMDIAVAGYALAGNRVKSGDCILCQRCVDACPRGTLRLTLGFDVAGRTSFTERRVVPCR